MNFNAFKTLKFDDPEFEDYLLGSGIHIRNNTIPLPVKTLNVGTATETVTFQVFTKFEIIRPGVFSFVAALIKLHSFSLILMPLFYVLVKNFLIGNVNDPLSFCLATLAALFLYSGFNIRNDIVDHLSGYDRVNILKSNKPIARGWISAHAAQKTSWFLIFGSAIFAVPAVLRQRPLLWLAALTGLTLFFGQFFKRNSYKYKPWGEVVLFALAGPCLTAGFQLALGGELDQQVLLFGLFWGVGVLFLVHVNNFSHLLTSCQAGIWNTMTRMGFDRAKKVLVGWWGFFCVLWIFFHFISYGRTQAAIATGLLLFFSVRMIHQVLQLQSPVGSKLDQIRHQAFHLFLLMVLILFGENVWLISEKFNWSF